MNVDYNYDTEYNFLFNVGRLHAERNFLKCYTTKFYQPSHIRLLLSLWFNQHSAVSYLMI